jgi:predicted RNA-binding protein
MPYYTDLFSPETYEAFSRSQRDVSGFRKHQETWAKKIQPGDKLICYMTRLSRWVGVLEVLSSYYVDSSPLFYSDNDPFVVRFKVKPIVWLAKDATVPIREKQIWDTLSFTKDTRIDTSHWTGKLRISLNHLDDADGKFLEQLLIGQQSGGIAYPVDEEQFQKLVSKPIRRQDKVVAVTVPRDDEEGDGTTESSETGIRESHQIQALLARIGEAMGYKIWIPKQDRSAVMSEWQPSAPEYLLNILPLNYDEPTLKTIEQIDVLWLKGKAIIRAFEVEHTTAVYSGILRMADLLALQPNMDIRLHIVAPDARKDKVFTEIRRPVFALLDRGPLSDQCSFISYDSLRTLSELQHLAYMSDRVLEEYAEEPE